MLQPVDVFAAMVHAGVNLCVFVCMCMHGREERLPATTDICYFYWHCRERSHSCQNHSVHMMTSFMTRTLSERFQFSQLMLGFCPITSVHLLTTCMQITPDSELQKLFSQSVFFLFLGLSNNLS